MHVVGRYHKVRAWNIQTGHLTAPLIIDRREKSLTPYSGSEEWYKTKDGYWIPTPLVDRYGMAAMAASDLQFGVIGSNPKLGMISSAGPSTYDLDSNYNPGVSGDAIAARHISQAIETIDSIYFRIGFYTGTGTNVNDIDLEFRRSAVGNPLLPDFTALIEGKVVDPGGATGWIQSTGWTAQTQQGDWNDNIDWIIIGDKDGQSSHSAHVQHESRAGISDDIWGNYNHQTKTSSVGFSTTPGSTSERSSIILVTTNGKVYGSATAVRSAVTTALQKGLRIKSGFKADIDICGVVWFSTSGTWNGFKVYEGSDGPEDTPAHNGNKIMMGNNGAFTDGYTYRLTKDTPYSIVCDAAASTNGGPWKNAIGTGADANLRKALPGNGDWHWREEASGVPNDWSNDDEDAIPSMSILIDDFVSSGGGLLTHPGMSGGVRG